MIDSVGLAGTPRRRGAPLRLSRVDYTSPAGLTNLDSSGVMSLNDIIGRLALVLLRFDPIPFCDLFKRQGFASWAEERSPYEWYIYFYRPGVRASADVRTPLSPSAFFRAAVAGH